MKEKILQAALKVLNQKGIQNSTLRDIAKEVPISDGHLRYYYKTKEDLILACFTQMDQTIAALAVQETTIQPVGESLIEALTKSFEVMHDYAFFFTESPILMAAEYPKIHAAYQKLIKSRQALFLDIFQRFQANGVFMPNVDASLFPVLFEQFFILSDNWVKYESMLNKDNQQVAKQIKHYVALCISLFLPYFNSDLNKEVTFWVKYNF